MPDTTTPSNAKYVVVLEPDEIDRDGILKTQDALGVKLTSSAELGGGVKAKDIYDAGSGIVFKNLKVAVVDDLDVKRLRKADRVIHVEREQVFRPVGSPGEAIANLRRAVGMITTQLDELEDQISALTEPTEPEEERLTWGLRAVGADTSRLRGAGIRVCVADTGIDASHPDFTGRVIEGKTFISNEKWNVDRNGHGTHCCGTIAGHQSRENGLRYGIAPDVDLMVAKVLADNGDGTTGSIIDGLDWALEKGARVISLSFGAPTGIGTVPSPVFEAIGERAMAQNCLIVAAAGNQSKRPGELPRPVSIPANAQSILSVAALTRKLRVANFSNGGINAGNGGRVDIAAPGVDVYSTFSRTARRSREYRNMDGTSMAAPYVSAIAALYLERYPSLSPSELWLRLEKNASILDGQHRRDVGAGLVRVLPD